MNPFLNNLFYQPKLMVNSLCDLFLEEIKGQVQKDERDETCFFYLLEKVRQVSLVTNLIDCIR